MNERTKFPTQKLADAIIATVEKETGKRVDRTQITQNYGDWVEVAVVLDGSELDVQIRVPDNAELPA